MYVSYHLHIIFKKPEFKFFDKDSWLIFINELFSRWILNIFYF